MKLILGTAQLGLKYGITNKDEKPVLNEALEIFNIAYNNGISIFDTARAYGDSEYKLGIFKKSFKNDIILITKLHIEGTDNIEGDILNSVKESIRQLQCENIDVLLLHDFKYLQNKRIIAYLLSLKNEKLY